MRIELVNTGTELVLGDTINTNASWIGQRMAAFGEMVDRQTVVPDGDAVREAISEAMKRADVVLATGGLGPTNDDLSRDTAADLLGLSMHQDDSIVASLEGYFAKRGKKMSQANLKQAQVPEGAEVMDNPFGTAPGLYFPAELGAVWGLHCHLFLLPGPPRELKPMVENHVEPRLREWLDLGGEWIMRYVKITGVGESDIVESVEKDLEAVPGLELGYCIGKGDVDIRLSGDPSIVEGASELVRERLGRHIVSEDRRVIEKVIIDRLTELGQTVATAESCTGGLIANRLTDVSGASAVFGHGFVTYANEAKMKHLGVPDTLLEQHGAVSEPVAKAMAEGCLSASGADHAIAVTGIAGPTGGSEEKPVGTVYLGQASKGSETRVERRFFPGTRDRFKLLTSQGALDMLRRRLVGM
jgi:nicotinamide-nucleotide amidase